MRFLYDEARTAQAAAYLVSLGGGDMNYMKLMKLLYLSDRQALIQTGLPISGDRWVSMPHGPVLSATLDLIKDPGGDARIGSPWHEQLTTHAARRAVSLRAGLPELDELSEYHLSTLKDVYCKFGNMKPFALRDWTHKNLPEYEDPKGSSRPIEPTKVLEVAGVPAERIEHIERDADEDWYVRSLERSVR